MSGIFFANRDIIPGMLVTADDVRWVQDETRVYNCGGLPVELTLPEGDHDILIEWVLAPFGISFCGGWGNTFQKIEEYGKNWIR
jgi:hypothetical protein